MRQNQRKKPSKNKQKKIQNNKINNPSFEVVFFVLLTEDGDGDAVYRAGAVVDVEFFEIGKGFWVAGMFTTNANLDFWVNSACGFYGDFDQFSYTLRIDCLKNIFVKNTVFNIFLHKFSAVIS